MTEQTFTEAQAQKIREAMLKTARDPSLLNERAVSIRQKIAENITPEDLATLDANQLSQLANVLTPEHDRPATAGRTFISDHEAGARALAALDFPGHIS